MIPQISEAEYEVMKIIWRYSPISTNDVVNKLSPSTSWSPKTIHTLINRLVRKKAITYTKESRVFIYTPLITQNKYLEHKSEIFLDHYFDGDLSALMSNYMNNQKVTENQLKNLRSLLNSSETRKE